MRQESMEMILKTLRCGLGKKKNWPYALSGILSILLTTCRLWDGGTKEKEVEDVRKCWEDKWTSRPAEKVGQHSQQTTDSPRWDIYQYVQSRLALAEWTLKTWKLVGQETKSFLFSTMVNGWQCSKSRIQDPNDSPPCSCHALRRAGGLWMRVKKARHAGGEAWLLIKLYAFAAKRPNAPHWRRLNGLPELIVMVACLCWWHIGEWVTRTCQQASDKPVSDMSACKAKANWQSNDLPELIITVTPFLAAVGAIGEKGQWWQSPSLNLAKFCHKRGCFSETSMVHQHGSDANGQYFYHS